MTQETAPEPLQTAESTQKEFEIDLEETKFCSQCTHLIGVKHNEKKDNNWRCGHSQNSPSVQWGTDLVTGNKFRMFIWNDISHVRYEDCKGKWFELYIPPDHTVPTIKGLEATEIVFDDNAQQ